MCWLPVGTQVNTDLSHDINGSLNPSTFPQVYSVVCIYICLYINSLWTITLQYLLTIKICTIICIYDGTQEMFIYCCPNHQFQMWYFLTQVCEIFCLYLLLMTINSNTNNVLYVPFFQMVKKDNNGSEERLTLSLWFLFFPQCQRQNCECKTFSL